jgi:hypothetical protein
MGIDKSLHDDYPSVIIGGTRYHFGRELEYGQYLVENANYAKDYWCFKTKEDMLAFLVNLPESADRNRMKKLYPDWHEVTHEQRDAYFEDSAARLRVAMEEKQKAGTAQHFPVYPDDGSGPYCDKEPFRINSQEPPLVGIEQKIHDMKVYENFPGPLTEAGKLSVLERFDWSGVSAKDKETILEREVDFRGITQEDLEFIYRNLLMSRVGYVEDGIARKLFTAATQPRSESGSESNERDADARQKPADKLTLDWVANWVNRELDKQGFFKTAQKPHEEQNATVAEETETTQHQHKEKETESMATTYERNFTMLMRLLGLGDKDHIRIENKGYMPLTVERVDRDLISLCHYGELNGDLMRDPEVVFTVSADQAQAQPVYFRNDYAGMEHTTIPGRFGDVLVQPSRQKSLDAFVTTWMNNIREQGFIKKAEQLHAERAKRALLPKVNFGGTEYEVEFQQYQNGRTALLLLENGDRDSATIATVNIPEVPLEPNEVLIKNYSENAGVLNALEKAGIVRAKGLEVMSGYATVPVCELLITPEQVNQAQHGESKQQENAQNQPQEKQFGIPDKGYHTTLMELLRDEVSIEIEVPGHPPLTVEWLDKDLVSVTSYAKHPKSGELIAAPEIIFQLQGNEAKPVYEHHEFTGRHYTTIPDRFADAPYQPEEEVRVRIVAAMLMCDIREHGYLDRAKELHGQQHAERNEAAEAAITTERSADMTESSDREQSADRKKPAARLSLGNLSAAIWRNESEKGEYLTLTVERRYSVKDENGQEQWKTSKSFRESDLARLQEIAKVAQKEMQYHRQQINREQQTQENENKVTR